MILQSLFGGVPIGQFGWNFVWMHKIWFHKNFIPASRLNEDSNISEVTGGCLEADCPKSYWNLLNPHIWYLNDFPWLRDVKNDLGLERPRISKEVIQPRSWNKNFAKSNFIHSHKISAKSANALWEKRFKNRKNFKKSLSNYNCWKFIFLWIFFT